jgi:NTP pyrophosphatase (non-canonical NTP hydrolase)
MPHVETKRVPVTQDHLKLAHVLIDSHLRSAIDKMGNGSLISNHETLGVLSEEVYELTRAIHENRLDSIHEEMADIAICAIFGLASSIARMDGLDDELLIRAAAGEPIFCHT